MGFENSPDSEKRERGDDIEPTPENVADACEQYLDFEQISDIREQDGVEGALGVAFTHLIDRGHDPEAVLKNLDILE